MLLNRYGLVDLEALFTESDEKLRRLERSHIQQNTSESRASYERELIRQHGRKAAHQKLIQPHVDQYQMTAKDAMKAETLPSGGKGRAQRRKARKARADAATNLRSEARRLGRHSGEFLRPQSGEARRDHSHRLATMHGGIYYGVSRFTNGESRFSFIDNSAADDFHTSLQHHYPHWKSYRSARSNASYSHSVRFRPVDWEKEHD